MGKQDKVALDTWSVRQAGRGSVGLFLSSRFVDHGAAPYTLAEMPVRLHGIEAAQKIPLAVLGELALAIVEVDPLTPGSIERLSQLIECAPSLPVIAAVAAPDVAVMRALVRQGVADVVALPIERNEAEQIALDVLARQAAKQEVSLCPMVSVVHANGGAGATTTATQLVARLGSLTETDRQAILIDLDVQFGAASDYLGLDRGNSILPLIGSSDRLDDALLHSILSERDDFAVLASPEDIVSLGSVDLDGLLATLDFIRGQHSVAVLDLPSNWSDWSLSLAAGSNLVLIVTELTIPSLRQAKRILELFDRVGVNRSNVRLVLNKVEKRLFSALKLEDAEQTLMCKALAALPLEPAIVSAQQQGQLIDEHARRSKYSQELTKLAAGVRAMIGEDDQ